MPATTSASTPRHDPRSPPFDVCAEIRRWRDEVDTPARDRVFDWYFPMANRLAGRYHNPYEPNEDLAQVAAVGLLNAIDRFDPDQGSRFESYAVPTILGELKRYFRDTGWSAHVPRRAQELALAIDRAVAALAGLPGRPAHVEEIADFLQIDPGDVMLGLQASQAHFAGSLDSPVSGASSEEPTTWGDRIGGPDENFDLVDTKLAMTAILTELPRPERTALRLRLEGGLDGDLRQIDIARAMGCSQMQVSRLLHRAAGRVRARMNPELTRDRRTRGVQQR